MNSCNFIGRIGRDAETRTAGSSDVTSWTLAVDVGYGGNKSTLWLDCAMWGDRGSKVAGYIKKGDMLGVTGEIGLREYEKNGQTKTVATLRVADVKLIGGKPSEGGEAAARKPAAKRPAAQTVDENDEIPW